MTRSDDDAARVSAEAYTAIQNLYARYNWCSDAGDADGYAECFTEDGELSIAGIGMHIRGRENLREFKRRDKARRGDRIRRHWNSGLFLETAGEHTIRGRCYLHGYDGAPGQAPLLNAIGSYDDTIIRRAGDCRVPRRAISLSHRAFRPAPETPDFASMTIAPHTRSPNCSSRGFRARAEAVG